MRQSGPAASSPVAPAEPRVDHDLLAGVATHSGTVRAGNQGQRKTVGGTGRIADEQVAAVQRRGSQLDHDLAGSRGRVVDVLVREDTALADEHGLHRLDPTAARSMPVRIGLARERGRGTPSCARHLGELWDLAKLGGLAAWDQQTMMPPHGGRRPRPPARRPSRRLVHERLVSDELGRLLEELRPYEESLDHDSDEASLIRVARRDREKELARARRAARAAGARRRPRRSRSGSRRAGRRTSSSSGPTSSGTSSSAGDTRPASRSTSPTTPCSTTSSPG